MTIDIGLVLVIFFTITFFTGITCVIVSIVFENDEASNTKKKSRNIIVSNQPEETFDFLESVD